MHGAGACRTEVAPGAERRSAKPERQVPVTHHSLKKDTVPIEGARVSHGFGILSWSKDGRSDGLQPARIQPCTLTMNQPGGEDVGQE